MIKEATPMHKTLKHQGQNNLRTTLIKINNVWVISYKNEGTNIVINIQQVNKIQKIQRWEIIN